MIDFDAGQSLWIHGEVESTLILIPALLWQPEAFLANGQFKAYRDMLFFGLMLTLSFYCLVLFLATRMKAYLAFASFSLTVTAFFAILFGYAFQYLWPQKPLLNDLIITWAY